jgi:hypothetical protein
MRDLHDDDVPPAAREAIARADELDRLYFDLHPDAEEYERTPLVNEAWPHDTTRSARVQVFQQWGCKIKARLFYAADGELLGIVGDMRPDHVFEQLILQTHLALWVPKLLDRAGVRAQAQLTRDPIGRSLGRIEPPTGYVVAKN